MVGAMPGGAMTVTVDGFAPRQQPVERVDQIVVGSGAHLDHDQTRGRMRDEHRQ